MPTFVAIKIHYDHRASLATHLKYSKLPTLEEYNEYVSLFQNEGIGGNGFHECLNFAIPQLEAVKFYLTPTSIPAKTKIDDEFVIFSFTYKGDREFPAHIVGIHAGARLLSTEKQGIPRDERHKIEGVDALSYHAEAPAELVTLLTPPLKYDRLEGIYTPVYQKWGFGRHYIEASHAANIITASLANATRELNTASVSKRTVIQQQIEVLRRIGERYSLLPTLELLKYKRNGHWVGGLPNTEIGYEGEELIYEREIAYVKNIGCTANEVEWISQVVPTSPFDIKTLRQSSNGEIQEHFIEVKSSASIEDTNVYISSGQISFFEEKEDQATFALVKFSAQEPAAVRDLTLTELRAEFDLIPIKFKLKSRVID